MKLVRVSRIFKMTIGTNSYTEKYDELMHSSAAGVTSKLLNLLFILGYVSHVVGCFFALVGRTNEPSWHTLFGGGDEVDDWGLTRSYITAVYWAMTTMTQIQASQNSTKRANGLK